jgi:hypothetical protein
MALPIRKALEQEYREVGNAYSDLKNVVDSTSFSGWDKTVFAPHLLGDGVPIDAWKLAEYFLRSWNDWRILCERYKYHYNTEILREWEQLSGDCNDLMAKLSSAGKLDELIHDYWTHDIQLSDKLTASQDSIDRTRRNQLLYHLVVSNHSRLALATTISRSSLHQPTGEHVSLWPLSRRVAEEINKAIWKAWPAIPIEARNDACWHFNHYRDATLLGPSHGLDDRSITPVSALVQILESERTHQRADALSRRLIDLVQAIFRFIADGAGRLANTNQLFPLDTIDAFFGGISTSFYLERGGTQIADDGDQPQLSEMPQVPYVQVARSQLHIGLPDSAVPFGVARIVATNESHTPVASKLVVLEQDSGNWCCRLSIGDLFGNQLLSGRLGFHVVPADERTLDCFRLKDILKLQESVSELWTEERKRIAKLVAILEERNG